MSRSSPDLSIEPVLLARLDREIESLGFALANGQATDYVQYRETVGRRAGLMSARETIIEFFKNVEKELLGDD